MMRVIWISLVLIVSVDSLLRFILLAIRWLYRRDLRSPSTASVGWATVLIAARDEAGSIGGTIESLLPLLAEWPGSRICVIADNCADATAEEAGQHGAQVATRTGGRLGKGAAIAWWMSTHRDSSRADEVIVILDADSRVVPGSLGALRNAFASGALVGQAFVSPDADNTSARLAGYSEVLMQRIDDEARRRLGWSVPLRGTGMAFKADLLESLTPLLHTLAEDLELDVLLASRGVRVRFVPDAVVLDPKPRESRGVSQQRARWFQGQFQVLRDYPGPIFNSLTHGGTGTWMLIPLLFLRPKLLLILIRVLTLIAGILIGAPLWWIVALALAADAIYYLSGAAIAENPRRYLLDLLSAPRYLLLWALGLVLAVFRRGGWLRAGR